MLKTNQSSTVQAANTKIVVMLSEFEYAHFEQHSPVRVDQFNSQCKQIEDSLFLVPHTKRALVAIRRAKNACFWEEALKHLAQAEKETR
ncbi:hypothetical protein [Vibrio harveyi]|uniref:hypothetical protein n=1 Tax=Vibrio harveyi TaxID=669 RepID=UPI00237FDE57|nr:hypothetical protein [Vibrio harveyi]